MTFSAVFFVGDQQFEWRASDPLQNINRIKTLEREPRASSTVTKTIRISAKTKCTSCRRKRIECHDRPGICDRRIDTKTTLARRRPLKRIFEKCRGRR